ncbi:hypothetical protein [Variovorax paradoxus]|uniref:hypothetical protein n=1 Tax=Variovorax paradoxus TaxID=34073 RepID=UPI003ECD8878
MNSRFSGRAPADGVRGEANVPRPAASSLISLRKAPHQRERDAEWSLISDTPALNGSAKNNSNKNKNKWSNRHER